MKGAGKKAAKKAGGRTKNKVRDTVVGRQTEAQSALIKMAKKDSRRVPNGKGPVSKADADAYAELANEVNVPVRAGPNDLNGAHGYAKGKVPAGPGAEHMHVNGEHVPVPSGYTPPAGSKYIG